MNKTNTIETILKEFDGLELRTTQGNPPHDIVVNRESVKAFLRSALTQVEKKTREEMIDKSLAIVDRWNNLHPSIMKAEILKLKENNTKELSSGSPTVVNKLSTTKEEEYECYICSCPLTRGCEHCEASETKSPKGREQLECGCVKYCYTQSPLLGGKTVCYCKHGKPRRQNKQ